MYCTESNNGAVLTDSTTSIDPDCTVSEKLNLSFPAVEAPAATLDGLDVESVGAAWSIIANS